MGRAVRSCDWTDAAIPKQSSELSFILQLPRRQVPVRLCQHPSLASPACRPHTCILRIQWLKLLLPPGVQPSNIEMNIYKPPDTRQNDIRSCFGTSYFKFCHPTITRQLPDGRPTNSRAEIAPRRKCEVTSVPEQCEFQSVREPPQLRSG